MVLVTESDMSLTLLLVPLVELDQVPLVLVPLVESDVKDEDEGEDEGEDEDEDVIILVFEIGFNTKVISLLLIIVILSIRYE
jgi:hypothetical protein